MTSLTSATSTHREPSVRDVLILGAGGLGRELYHWAKAAGFQPIGFIDDNLRALDAFPEYPAICGTLETVPLTAPVLCGIGNNAIRIPCVKKLKARGATFATCIHPQALVLEGSTFGEGAIVAPFAYVACNVETGDFPFLQSGSVLGHDVKAGDFLRMDTTAFVGGFARLGDNVTLYTGAKVMPERTVGDNATLGAASLLITNLPADTTAFGVPAQKL